MEEFETQAEPHPCVSCGAPAEFYSPSGFLCDEHAQNDAALNLWIPEKLSVGNHVESLFEARGRDWVALHAAE